MTNDEISVLSIAIGKLQSGGYTTAANVVAKLLFEYGKLVGEKSVIK